MNLREVLKLRGPAKSGKFKSIEIAFHTNYYSLYLPILRVETKKTYMEKLNEI